MIPENPNKNINYKAKRTNISFGNDTLKYLKYLSKHPETTIERYEYGKLVADQHFKEVKFTKKPFCDIYKITSISIFNGKEKRIGFECDLGLKILKML